MITIIDCKPNLLQMLCIQYFWALKREIFKFYSPVCKYVK